MTTGYITLEESQAASWAAMTPEEQAEYKAAYAEAGVRMHLAELVHNARTAAGLSQTALALRAGTKQTISAIERGARVPGGLMLENNAQALGMHLAFQPNDTEAGPAPADESATTAG